MKILHLYWGRNAPLSYLRYLTAESFSRLNPGWEIRVHSPDAPTYSRDWSTPEHKEARTVKDHFDRLAALPGLTFHQHRLPHFSEVHRSDLLRWKLLGESGGIWSDFDVYYLKPIPEEIEQMKTGLCRMELKNPVYPVGFMASKPANPFFIRLYNKALSTVPKGYQDLGRTLLEAHIDGTEELFNPDCIYPVRPNRVKDLFQNPVFPPETFGVHWYAGHRETKAAEEGDLPAWISNTVS